MTSFFDKLQKSSSPDQMVRLRLFFVVLAAAIFSKGPVLFSGFSFDDYAFTQGVDSYGLALFLQQGRYLLAAINYFIESTGVAINGLYFPLGMLALLLQSGFIVCIFEFAGVSRERFAALAGAIMVAHPYSTEIYTYRLALAGYCLALFFSILAMGSLLKPELTWRRYLLSLVAVLGMLFTYQSFLNYFAALIIFTFIFCCFNLGKMDYQMSADGRMLRIRGIIWIVFSALIIFLLTIWCAKWLGVSEITARGQFLKFSQISTRLSQSGIALEKIYWIGEVIFPRWLKIVSFGVSVVALFCVLCNAVMSPSKQLPLRKFILLGFALLMIAPASLGVILAFDDWWPVPRVVAQVALIFGFVFLIATFASAIFKSRIFDFFIASLGILILVSFVFLSNQIFVDQNRLNRWDAMMANRIISRLEEDPKFPDIKSIYVDGGAWRYPEKLRTIQGDMNVSAFFPASSKNSLLAEATGYRFEKASSENIVAGEEYCRGRKPWPNVGAVTVLQSLAVVCLGK